MTTCIFLEVDLACGQVEWIQPLSVISLTMPGPALLFCIGFGIGLHWFWNGFALVIGVNNAVSHPISIPLPTCG